MSPSRPAPPGPAGTTLAAPQHHEQRQGMSTMSKAGQGMREGRAVQGTRAGHAAIGIGIGMGDGYRRGRGHERGGREGRGKGRGKGRGGREGRGNGAWQHRGAWQQRGAWGWGIGRVARTVVVDERRCAAAAERVLRGAEARQRARRALRRDERYEGGRTHRPACPPPRVPISSCPPSSHRPAASCPPSRLRTPHFARTGSRRRPPWTRQRRNGGAGSTSPSSSASLVTSGAGGTPSSAPTRAIPRPARILNNAVLKRSRCV